MIPVYGALALNARLHILKALTQHLAQLVALVAHALFVGLPLLDFLLRYAVLATAVVRQVGFLEIKVENYLR